MFPSPPQTGYRDSGADIACTLSKLSPDVDVLTSAQNPSPASDDGWCFPDSEEGILAAVDRGATHLWANTILFASHPLQISPRIGAHGQNIRVVGQGPLVVDSYDDKDLVNALLRRQGAFTMPRAWTLHLPRDEPQLDQYPYPVVGKPARGRGSHGVKVCHDACELATHVESLAAEGLNVIIIEEYLAGEEATVTVMPPSDGEEYRALPVVARFNHHDGIAPYNGVVAVTANSRAVVDSDDPAYDKVSRECERAAAFLGTTAPIRVDVRRFSEGSDFALFDVNMKPVRDWTFWRLVLAELYVANPAAEYDGAGTPGEGRPGEPDSDGCLGPGLGLWRAAEACPGYSLDTGDFEEAEASGGVTSGCLDIEYLSDLRR